MNLFGCSIRKEMKKSVENIQNYAESFQMLQFEQ